MVALRVVSGSTRSPSSETSLAPTVSVIVPVFGQVELLTRCLTALTAQDYAGSVEVIVVNNGNPADLGGLQARFPDFLFIEEPLPGSYNARNAGIARARGDIFAFTDADCVPDSRWLSTAVPPLTGDARCGLVGGRVHLTPRDPAKPSAAELYDQMFGINQRHYVTARHFAATANMVTRRDVIEKIGRFRGDLLSGGDVEWGQRAFTAGYGLIYEDGARVLHPARDYRELIRKLRRTAAGERDQNPDWPSCVRACLKRLAPFPLHTLRLIAEGRETPMSPWQKAELVGLTGLLRWRAIVERLRLQLQRGASPRA